MSKFFNENSEKHQKHSYIKKCGITDPAKVLYCFRHTVESAFINHPNNISHDTIDHLLGHEVKSTGRKHYGSFDMATLYRELCKLEYPKAKFPWDKKGYRNVRFSWE